MKLRALLSSIVVLTIACVSTVVGVAPASAQSAVGSIRGVVVDDRTTLPIGGVGIRLNDDPAVIATTDESGSFLIPDLFEGSHLLIASMSGYFEAGQYVSVFPDNESSVALQLTPMPASFVSTLRDADGNPVAGMTAHLQLDSNCCFPSGTVITDSSGVVEFGMQAGLSYTLTVTDPSGYLVTEPIPLVLAPGEQRTAADIIMLPTSGPIRGVYVDDTGVPVANANLNWTDCISTCSARTDNLGRFGISDVVATNGRAIVSAYPPPERDDLAASHTSIDVIEGQLNDVRLVAARPATLNGTITLDGELSTTEVSIDVLFPGPFGYRAHYALSYDGSFSITGLVPGDYVLKIEPSSQDFVGEFYPNAVRLSDAEHVTVTSGATTTVAIDLERPATASGVLLGSDGLPHDGAVQLYPALAPEALSQIMPCNLPVSETDRPGTYRVGCLRPDVQWIAKSFPFQLGNQRYWNGTTAGSESFENATPITVSPAAETTGIDFVVGPPQPDFTFTSITPDVFTTGETTEAIVRGSFFPTDPNALKFGFDYFIGEPQIAFRTIEIIDSTTARIQVTPEGPRGPYTQYRRISAYRSTGGGSECSCGFWLRDPGVPLVGTISGTVTAWETGQPIAGAAIFLTDQTVMPNGTETPAGFTDATGVYTLTEVPMGSKNIGASAPEFKFRVLNSLPVSVAGGQTVTGIDFQLFPTLGAARVTVADDAGLPIQGVNVWPQNAYEGRVLTDAAGVAVIENLDTGVYPLTIDDPANRYQVTTVEVTAERNVTVSASVTLAPTTTGIRGIVRDTSGSPVAGARVSETFYGQAEVTTGADGSFILDVGLGGYQLTIWPPDDQAERLVYTNTDFIQVFDGAFTEVSPVLPSVARFNGFVFGDGAPFSGATVVVFNVENDGIQQSATTAADGSYSIGVRQAGRYRVLVYANAGFLNEYYPDGAVDSDGQIFDVALGQTFEATIELERESAIVGSMAFPLNEPGVAALKVYRLDPTGSTEVTTSYAYESAFRIGGLRAGTYAVAAFPYGAVPEVYDDSLSLANATPIVVPAVGESAPIEFAFEATRTQPTLTGVSPNFFRIDTTTTNVRFLGENLPSDLAALQLKFTDLYGEGAVTLTRWVSANEVIGTVTIGANPYVDGLRSIELSVGGFVFDTSLCACSVYLGDATVEVGSIAGRVTDRAGRPLGGLGVVVDNRLVGQDRVSRRVITGADGRWSSDGLPVGSYFVTFEGSATHAGQFWRETARSSQAAAVLVRAGGTVRRIDARLGLRAGAPTLTAGQVGFTDIYGSKSVVLSGTNLSALSGMTASLIIGYDPVPLLVRALDNGRIELSPFGGIWYTGGGSVELRWTGADGSTMTALCDQCVEVLDQFSMYPFSSTSVVRGTETTIQFGGQGFAHLTSFVSSVRGVRVTSWSVDDFGILNLTVAAGRRVPVGPATITVTRADGATATFTVDVT